MARIGYAEACKKSRLSRQRLMESDLAGQGRAWRIWAVCNELTAGYSKAEDRVYVTKIAAMADVVCIAHPSHIVFDALDHSEYLPQEVHPAGPYPPPLPQSNRLPAPFDDVDPSLTSAFTREQQCGPATRDARRRFWTSSKRESVISIVPSVHVNAGSGSS